MKSASADYTVGVPPMNLLVLAGDVSYNVTVNVLYYFKMHAKVQHVNPKGIWSISH
jgi:hypothetical protein